jgi:hypothetical protein
VVAELGAFTGLAVGASVGMATAADQLAVPGLLGVAGAAAGTAVGLLLAGADARDRPRRGGRRPTLTSQPPPSGDGSPGWYPDPLGSPSLRLWDGVAWTSHVWRRSR